MRLTSFWNHFDILRDCDRAMYPVDQWLAQLEARCVLGKNVLNAHYILICVDIMNEKLTSLVNIYCNWTIFQTECEVVLFSTQIGLSQVRHWTDLSQDGRFNNSFLCSSVLNATVTELSLKLAKWSLKIKETRFYRLQCILALGLVKFSYIFFSSFSFILLPLYGE